MKLYHSSNIGIEEIDLSKSNPNKDFGKGFYLSDDYEQARKMAHLKVLTLGGEETVTEFQFDEKLMSSSEMKIKVFMDYSSEWADFVLANRDGSQSVEHYDIVYGPIADDRVGLQIRKLKDGSIDKDEFLHRLKYMKGITFQYFFGTEKSIGCLKRI